MPLDPLQNFLDDFGPPACPLTRDEKQSLQHRGHGHDRADEQRPHDRAAVGKNLDHDFLVGLMAPAGRTIRSPPTRVVQNT
jgi:hypothetical protein